MVEEDVDNDVQEENRSFILGSTNIDKYDDDENGEDRMVDRLLDGSIVDHLIDSL